MTNSLISIIIPCYNAAEFINEAINSALGQTYPHTEVIVIDDGSTDDSLEVLKSYGDRIRWETGPNRGGCAARNRGLELARGEMIQFLDADDILAVQKLERQAPFLVSSGADAVFCDVKVIDFETKQQVDFFRPFHTDSFRNCCLDQIQTSAPLHWKKNLLAVGAFDEQLPCAQERDLHVRMACFGFQFQHLAETLVTLRRRPKSVSADYRRVLRTRRGIARRAQRLLEERNQFDDARSRTLAGMLARDARAFLRMGEVAEAHESFAAARQMHAEGGLDVAYTRPARLMMRLLGPHRAESVIQFKRSFAEQT